MLTKAGYAITTIDFSKSQAKFVLKSTGNELTE